MGGHVEKKFETDNNVNISAYFRINLAEKKKDIELINADLLQYGKTGNAKKDKEMKDIYMNNDKNDARIGVSRPVRFRVWYEAKSKNILASATIYNPIKMTHAGYKNTNFKKK